MAKKVHILNCGENLCEKGNNIENTTDLRNVTCNDCLTIAEQVLASARKRAAGIIDYKDWIKTSDNKIIELEKVAMIRGRVMKVCMDCLANRDINGVMIHMASCNLKMENK